MKVTVPLQYHIKYAAGHSVAVTCRKYQEKGLAIMGYVKWSYDTLNHFCGDVFKAFGFSEEEGSIIKDVLLTADLYGI